MRILWVKAGKLIPVNSGGSIRSYHILRCLAERHKVTLLSYYGGPRDEAYESEIGRHLPGAVALHTAGVEGSGLQRSIDYLCHLLRRAPYAVARFASPEVRRLITSWMTEGRCDVAVCDFLDAAINFPAVLPTPTVLFQHNVEWDIMWRHAETQDRWLKKLVFKFEAAKMARYERAAVRRFDHVIAVSDQDRNQMTRMTDPLRITVVPTGVDLGQFRQAAELTAAGRPLVIFTGAMDWEANVDAVTYFCRDIWPRIRAKAAEVRFRVVGRNPGARVKKLVSDSVEVTGTVPSVADHLREAAVVVVPLRIGGGTRLKIYEAMAMGKAVVSTSIGAEGLDVHHGRDIILADDASTFAEGVVRLLHDQGLRQGYELAAAELAAHYDWSKIAERFEQVLVQVASLSDRVSDPFSIRMAACG